MKSESAAGCRKSPRMVSTGNVRLTTPKIKLKSTLSIEDRVFVVEILEDEKISVKQAPIEIRQSCS